MVHMWGTRMRGLRALQRCPIRRQVTRQTTWDKPGWIRLKAPCLSCAHHAPAYRVCSSCSCVLCARMLIVCLSCAYHAHAHHAHHPTPPMPLLCSLMLGRRCQVVLLQSHLKGNSVGNAKLCGGCPIPAAPPIHVPALGLSKFSLHC